MLTVPAMSAFVQTTALPFSAHPQRRNLSPRRPSSAPRFSPRAMLPILPLADNPAALETVAAAFRSLNMPTWLVEWGHPGLMTFMVLGMGTPGAVLGWRGRLNKDRKAGVKQKKLHENIMLAFFLLAVLGGSGGTLSVAIQGYDVWQSPHFLSAALVLSMLTLNSILAYTRFSFGSDGTPKARIRGRKIHAWFGVATMTTFLLHAALGTNILLG